VRTPAENATCIVCPAQSEAALLSKPAATMSWKLTEAEGQPKLNAPTCARSSTPPLP